MANVEHSTLTGSDLHEPKGVSSAADGQVATASSSAVSWTKIGATNITDDSIPIAAINETSIKGLNKVYLTINIPDLSTTASYWMVIPLAGNISNVWSIIDGALATGDATITLEKAGVALTNGVITITQSGSAAGDIDSATPSAGNTFTAASAVEFVVAGTNSANVDATLTVELDIT